MYWLLTPLINRFYLVLSLSLKLSSSKVPKDFHLFSAIIFRIFNSQTTHAILSTAVCLSSSFQFIFHYLESTIWSLLSGVHYLESILIRYQSFYFLLLWKAFLSPFFQKKLTKLVSVFFHLQFRTDKQLWTKIQLEFSNSVLFSTGNSLLKISADRVIIELKKITGGTKSNAIYPDLSILGILGILPSAYPLLCVPITLTDKLIAHQIVCSHLHFKGQRLKSNYSIHHFHRMVWFGAYRIHRIQTLKWSANHRSDARTSVCLCNWISIELLIFPSLFIASFGHRYRLLLTVP